MKTPWRKAVLLTLLATGCDDLGGLCPDGTKLLTSRSKPTTAVWCRSPDRRTVRWVELHSDSRTPRAGCAYDAKGRAEGDYAAWHRNGKVWLRGAYRDGVKQGRWTQWSEAGAMVAAGDYRNGEFVSGAPVATPAQCEKLTVP